MRTQIPAVIAFLLCAGMSGCHAPAKHESSEPEQSSKVTIQKMRQLGIRACEGDLSALDELEQIKMDLYEGVDYKKDGSRLRSNLTLMRACFDEMGQRAGRGDAKAFRALLKASSRPALNGFTVDAFGMAAGMGHEASLDVLLNYTRHGFLLSSTVFALRPAAARNDARAVDFLIDVIDNERHRPLWNGASLGLQGAVDKGNDKARQAIERYEQYVNAKRRAKSRPAG